MKTSKVFTLFVILYLLCNSHLWSQESSVMTYNIKYDNKNDTINHWNKRKETLVRLIQHYAPDFLGTQEGLHHQIQYMDKALVNYNFTGVGRADGKIKGEYSALFYNKERHTLLKSSTFWLSETPEKPSAGWDAALERICTYGLFENKNTKKKIWVFNTHFDHIGKNARANSVVLLLKKIEALNSQNYPVLLIGDLNLQPMEAPIKRLSSHLDDGMKIAKKPFYGPFGTYNGFQNKAITRRIDYIFTKGVFVKSYEHIDDRLSTNRHISDHLPVFLIFESLK